MSGQTFQYETIGNSSYLIATFGNAKDLINYQMQMLANNEIPNILPVSKRQKNEDIQLCYNVTSKIPLAQAVSRNKIGKQSFLKLIEGTISAYNELSEYQLVSSGLVFDSEYVFVKIGSFEPSFVYIPVHSEDLGAAPLKDFLLSLILQSKVEITNDNFIQVILETLNSPTLTTDDLMKIVRSYQGKGAAPKSIVPEPPPRMPEPIISPLPPARNVPNPVAEPPVIEKKIETPVKNIPVNKKDTAEKVKKENSTKEEQPKSKKNLFLVIQLVFLGIIVALSMAGALNNEDGSMNFTYLLGVLIAVAGIDFVVYRELFKNSKEDKDLSMKKSSKQQVSKPLGVAVPGKNTPPVQSVSQKPVMPQKPNAPMNNHDTPKQPTPLPVQPPQPMPKPPSMPVSAQSPVYTPVGEFESEDTVVLTDENQGGAYLEFYENGLATKIKLDKESVIVGRLRGQVDFVISNSRIGKIHAEFISRNGEYFVKDYNSLNGTYINGSGQRITSNVEQQIYNGDRITLANFELILKC